MWDLGGLFGMGSLDDISTGTQWGNVFEGMGDTLWGSPGTEQGTYKMFDENGGFTDVLDPNQMGVPKTEGLWGSATSGLGSMFGENGLSGENALNAIKTGGGLWSTAQKYNNLGDAKRSREDADRRTAYAFNEEANSRANKRNLRF